MAVTAFDLDVAEPFQEIDCPRDRSPRHVRRYGEVTVADLHNLTAIPSVETMRALDEDEQH